VLIIRSNCINTASGIVFSVYMFRANSVLIITRSNCINTASGIVFSVYMFRATLCSSSGGQILLILYYNRCCINTISPPDDEHRVARNMYRTTIINISYNVIVHQVGHLPRVVPGCTVSKTKKIKKVMFTLNEMGCDKYFPNVTCNEKCFLLFLLDSAVTNTWSPRHVELLANNSFSSEKHHTRNIMEQRWSMRGEYNNTSGKT